MADIWNAYRLLNEAQGLGLTDEAILMNDACLKEQLLRQKGVEINSVVDADQWEAFIDLRPSKGSRLSRMTKDEIDVLRDQVLNNLRGQARQS